MEKPLVSFDSVEFARLRDVIMSFLNHLGRLAIIVLVFVAGCGPSRVRTYPTSGKVLFTDGQPVRSGMIELESLEHKTTATGQIQQDGSFVLGTFTPTDGAAAGKHRVIVVQIIISDGTVKHTKDHGRPVEPRYGRYESSGLTAEIQPAKQNEITITLDAPRDQDLKKR